MSIEHIFGKTPYKELEDQYELHNLHFANKNTLAQILSKLDFAYVQNKQVLDVLNSNQDSPVQDILAGLISYYGADADGNRAILDKLREAQKISPSQVSDTAKQKIDKALDIARLGNDGSSVYWLEHIKSSNLEAEIISRRQNISNWSLCASYSDDRATRDREGKEAQAMEFGLKAVECCLSGVGGVLKPLDQSPTLNIAHWHNQHFNIDFDKPYSAYREMLIKHFPVMDEEHKKFLDEGSKRSGPRTRDNSGSGTECSRFYSEAKKALLAIGQNDITEIKRELMWQKNNLIEQVKRYEFLPGHLRAFQQQFVQDSYQKFLRLLTVADHEYGKSLGQSPKPTVSAYSLG